MIIIKIQRLNREKRTRAINILIDRVYIYILIVAVIEIYRIK